MKFKVILADPPWKYNSRANHKTRFRGGADGHYPLMSMDDIKALPVNDLADSQSVLYLWCTFPFLREQLEVVKAWGFRYSTVAFSWTKLNPRGYIDPQKDKKWNSSKTYVLYPEDGLYHSVFFGVGAGEKSNLEICIRAYKGKVTRSLTNTVSSVILAPRRSHSRKPDEAFHKLDAMYGTGIPRIELFACPHEVNKDWVKLGYDIDGRDIRETIREAIEA